MKRLFILPMLFLLSHVAYCQYETPGTGIEWTMEDLVNNSGGVVTNESGIYFIHDSLTVSTSDKITITEDITVKLYEGTELIIDDGAVFIVNPEEQVVFTAYDIAGKYGVITVNEGSEVFINNAVFEYGSGIKVINSDFKIINSTIQEMGYTSGTSGAISGTRGKVYIENCRFINNERSALNSGANMGTTFTILNSYFYNNTLDNSNRPQINLGPCQENDTTKIIGNTVIGIDKDKVGGIGCSSLLGASSCYVVEDNIVRNNRYGVTMTGNNITGLIKDNQIIDNNLETNPNNGGSGINITATAGTNVVITGNIISGNLWGITLVKSGAGTGPICNLGNLTPGENYNIGWNKFNNNGNNGVLYDFYNNTPNDIMAQNNLWGVDQQTEEEIETVIFHKVDNVALGTVTFMSSYINEHNPPRNLTGEVMENNIDNYDIIMKWERPYAPIFEEIEYNIYYNNDLIITVDTITHSVENLAPGIYKYIIKALYSDGVESEGIEKEFIVAPVKNDITNQELNRIYPNPASDYINIDIQNIRSVEIYNISGQLMQKTGYSGNIDISDYENGIYIFKVQTDKSTYVDRIIISK